MNEFNKKRIIEYSKKYSVEKAAKRFNCGKSSIYKWRRSNDFQNNKYLNIKKIKKNQYTKMTDKELAWLYYAKIYSSRLLEKILKDEK